MTASSPAADAPVPAASEGAIGDIGLGIHRLSRLLASRRVSSALADAAGVPLTQQAVEVLRALAAGSARPVAELARAARMDVGAVSRQLRVLEEQQLIVRKPSAAHRSVVLVEPTAKGRRAVARIQAVRDRHFVDALGGWSDEEREQLGVLLLRLVDDLQHTPFRATQDLGRA